MTSPARFFALLSVLTILLPASAFAQWGEDLMPSSRAVAGSGSSTLQLAPTRLRMTVQILGRGAALQQALDDLDRRRAAAETSLAALKADADSIHFGNPEISQRDVDQQQQMQQMIIQRLGRGSNVPKTLDVETGQTVSQSLSAEWPLSAASPKELLLASHDLTQQIIAADLAGVSQTAGLSPEAEELAEEMAGMLSGYDEDEPQPGQPQFVYVATVPEEQLDQALADAFAKAKRNAERLARAAGAELGPLAGISGQRQGAGDEEMYYYNSRARYLMQQRAAAQTSQADNEAIGLTPGAVTYRVHCQAYFQLKQ